MPVMLSLGALCAALALLSAHVHLAPLADALAVGGSPLRTHGVRISDRLHHPSRAAAPHEIGPPMTRRGTRLFFFVSTLASAAIFVALTIDSHRQFPKLTHTSAIDASVVAGKNVWHRKNCINCHTLLGEGAYYAPDLTQITTQRGAAYLQEFLKDPSKFYSEERDGRLMPNLKLSDAGDQQRHRVPGLGEPHRHPGMAAAADPREGLRDPRGQYRRSPGHGGIEQSRGARARALQRDATGVRRMPFHRSGREHRRDRAWRASHRRPPPASAPATTMGRPRTPPATSASRS